MLPTLLKFNLFMQQNDQTVAEWLDLNQAFSPQHLLKTQNPNLSPKPSITLETHAIKIEISKYMLIIFYIKSLKIKMY